MSENKNQPTTVTPEDLAQLKAEITAQVVQSIQSEQQKERLVKLEERAKQQKAHEQYVHQMKQSTDPWVDVQGWVQDEHGVRVELEWNDAFVQHLKDNGVTGADEEQIIQRWVTILLRDMSDQIAETTPEQSQYS